MKEDTDTVLNALRRQREALADAIKRHSLILDFGPPLTETSEIACRGILSANEQELQRIDAEIERRTKPRKPSGRPPLHLGKIPEIKTMIEHGVQKKAAAKQLGIGRSTLYRMLAREARGS